MICRSVKQPMNEKRKSRRDALKAIGITAGMLAFAAAIVILSRLLGIQMVE